MGFHRTLQPAALDRAQVTRIVAEEVAFARRTTDPLAIDNRCPLSPSAIHQYIGSCGDVVCVHCARIAWQ